MASVGFCGKLPGKGDFIQRRVAPDFLEPWDAWLQEAMAASRTAAGPGWLDAYLTSPIWRFALAPGVCGSSGHVGALAPSVDRVGRYFPLTIVMPLAGSASALSFALRNSGWFAAAEELLAAAVGSDTFGFDDFDQRVAALADGAAADADLWRLRGAVPGHWHIALTSGDALAVPLAELFGGRPDPALEPFALWWTEGSERVAPSLLLTRALPQPQAFAAMIDGSWRQPPWIAVGGDSPERGVVTAPLPVPRELIPELDILASDAGDTVEIRLPPPAVETGDDDKRPIAAGLRLVSAAETHPGKVRKINQDAALERSEIGLWVVADGMGGHHKGELASGMIRDVLGALTATARLPDLVDAVRKSLDDVNQRLRELVAGADTDEQSICGSAVVALAARGFQGAVLWAGDCRAYRWRRGSLEQLTEDHSEQNTVDNDDPLAGVLGPDNIITRAVGAAETLDLALRGVELQAGDRFILCSDGVHKELQPPELARMTGAGDVDSACRAIAERVLSRQARDNLTLILIEAQTV